MSSPSMFENLKEHLKLPRITSKASPCIITSLETLKNAGWPFWNLAIIPLQSEHAYLYNQQNDLPRRSENKAKKKKFRLEQELNPQLLWFQCSALPTEQTLTSWLTSQLMFTSFVNYIHVMVTVQLSILKQD